MRPALPTRPLHPGFPYTWVHPACRPWCDCTRPIIDVGHSHLSVKLVGTGPRREGSDQTPARRQPSAALAAWISASHNWRSPVAAAPSSITRLRHAGTADQVRPVHHSHGRNPAASSADSTTASSGTDAAPLRFSEARFRHICVRKGVWPRPVCHVFRAHRAVALLGVKWVSTHPLASNVG
jgi:hypothetical protein